MKDSDKKYIPVIILLMATGWRISDILNIRYYNCLITDTNRNYYLQGDIPKTDVKQHRIPIDKDVALIIQAVIEQTKDMSTIENNPDRYLFVHTKENVRGTHFVVGIYHEH